MIAILSNEKGVASGSTFLAGGVPRQVLRAKSVDAMPVEFLPKLPALPSQSRTAEWLVPRVRSSCGAFRNACEPDRRAPQHRSSLLRHSGRATSLERLGTA